MSRSGRSRAAPALLLLLLSTGCTSFAAAAAPAVVTVVEGSGARWAGAPADLAPVDLSLLRVALPRGYDTVEARAARAAEESAAAAEVAAAARAAARAAEAAEERERAEAAAVARAVPRSRVAEPAVVSAAPEPRSPSGLPLGVDAGSSRQVVTVVAPSAGSTGAVLTAWERGADGWVPVLGPMNARVGSAGVGRASESSTRTPAGTFSLSEAFGRAGDPGTGLPYRVVDGDDWWVSDVHSPRYNQYAECARGTCDFDEAVSENLAEVAVYQHAVVLDYNRGGTPGAGSAFFLHVSNGAATAGCVAIDAGSLVALLRWLDPAARPLIAIGVG
ncbi:L,D-peptidoglycan transpeptidase YkuD, ErfK/YbiS/YcfS/YnhG family [Blastococcus fimeti]|nr:L,D-peptidoglycan transpeptidase YkuD, ErfK/YbiS/YcfS/YnhG family [Blastococcus fimeti]